MSRGHVHRRGEAWEPAHIERLKALLAAGNSHAEAAALMNRTIGAIKSKVAYLAGSHKKPAAEPRDNPWTPERLEILQIYWAKGETAARVGARLGVSRNAVIGKVNRMGLQRHKAAPLTALQRAGHGLTPRKPKPVPKPPNPPKPVAVKPEPKVFEAPKVSVLTGVRLQHGSGLPPRQEMPKDAVWRPLPGTFPAEFGAPGCKWPIDGFDRPMCCGQARGEDPSYCKAHRRIASSPVVETPAQMARKLRRFAA